MRSRISSELWERRRITVSTVVSGVVLDAVPWSTEARVLIWASCGCRGLACYQLGLCSTVSADTVLLLIQF